MTKNYFQIAVREDTYKIIKAMKEVHGITYDELINELLEK